MKFSVLECYGGITAVQGGAGAWVEQPDAVLLLKQRTVRVAEQHELRIDPPALKEQPRQSCFDAEQMPVRQKDACAADLTQKRRRSGRKAVTVSGNIGHIQAAEGVCKTLRVCDIVTEMKDLIRSFQLHRVIHITDGVMGVRENK